MTSRSAAQSKSNKSKSNKTKSSKTKSQPSRLTPPRAKKIPLALARHGVKWSDDFAWIKAANWQEVLRDPAYLPKPIRSLLEAENAYMEAVMAPTRTLQKRLVREMRGRMEEDESEVPAPDGPFAYYQRYRIGGQHPLICRRPRAGGRSKILLDGDALAKGKPFFYLNTAAHSPDHSLLAWSADEKGSEFCNLHIRDLSKGRDQPKIIPDTDGDALWCADSAGLFYVRFDANHRPNQVLLHRLQDQAADQLIFEEPDPAWFVHIAECQSGLYGTIDISDHETSESYLIDLRQPHLAPRLIAKRQAKVRYDVEHHGERLIILTNADGAEDFKIVTAPLNNPDKSQWVDLIPHRPGVMITGFLVLQDYLVRIEREEGLARIIVHHFASAQEHAIAFDDEAYDIDFDDVLEFDTSILRFSYSSMVRPEEIYDYDLNTRARVLRKRQKIPSGHDPERYVTRRLFATAPDGETIPISLLYARSTKLDGSAPCLLQGYGAYGYAYEAAFGSSRFSLVDRGFIFAIAHIRGGTDKGWRWYTSGKLAQKQNTFKDFIACGQHLANLNFTRTGHIVALGRSAGGMLMGAVANLAPELFCGIVAGVPFVDVLNTMLDDKLPLTPPEWLEWGNPIASKADFKTIRAYSPYENVKAQSYPAILATSGLTDPRVTYWEPTKWVAQVRDRMTGGGPVLLRTNMSAGHAGSAGRFDRLDELALDYAFAIAAAQSLLTAQAKPRKPSAAGSTGKKG